MIFEEQISISYQIFKLQGVVNLFVCCFLKYPQLQGWTRHRQLQEHIVSYVPIIEPKFSDDFSLFCLSYLVPPCQLDPPVCQNDATCTQGEGTNFICTCPNGFTGERCADDINECNNNPCAVTGQCRNTRGSFRCDCDAGYAGTLCELGR